MAMDLLTVFKRSRSSTNARNSFLLLSFIMILVCTIVLGIITLVLYHFELNSQKDMLQVTAQSQARLLESIAMEEFKTADSLGIALHFYDPVQNSIDQIADAHARYEGFGRTGEFTLARQEENQIVFVLRHRLEDIEYPVPVEFNSELAEPMRLALQGFSGTITGLDYRGETVLAAYEPVAVLNLGIVAKIDLSEIRAPFIGAVLVAAAVALFVIFIGTWLFFRIGNPIVKKLEAHSDELQREVDQRIKLNNNLQLSNKELERIVYVSSHDLRSPLVNIDGYSRELEQSIKEIYQIIDSSKTPETIIEAIRELLATDILEALRFIRTSAEKMDTLLTGLLKLSRFGRAGLNIVQLNMNKLILKVVESRDYQVRNSGVSIDVDTLPSCTGDKILVDQLFSNLIDNAIRYRDPARPGQISVYGREEDGMSVYCVTDNGIGIAPSHTKHIFEIFHRLNPDDTAGDGLGLAIVQKALSKLSGEIWVESEPGKGSSFFVSLPSAEE